MDAGDRDRIDFADRAGKFGLARLAQPFGPLQAGSEGGVEVVDEGEAAFDLGDDAVLLGQGWEWNKKSLESGLVQDGLPVADGPKTTLRMTP